MLTGNTEETAKPALTEVEQKQESAPTVADKAPPPKAAVVSQKEVPATTPRTTSPGTSAKSSTKEEDSDDDEPHPDDEGVIKMSLTAFNRRVQRASRSELRKLFGTDNIGDIVTMKQKLDSYEKEREEARQKSLSEIDKLREEAAVERKAREVAEARTSELQEDRLASQEDVHIRSIADEYIAPKYYKYAARDLREHLVETYDNDYDKVTDKVLKAWFKEYAEGNPELAVKSQEAEKPVAPITNGPVGTRPAAPPSGGPGGKDVRPGRPNSMSNAEWMAYRKQNGITY